ncbi:unnamed protein product, partial [Timema podura]|nr:unnamed protein product [Timema podura]
MISDITEVPDKIDAAIFNSKNIGMISSETDDADCLEQSEIRRKHKATIEKAKDLKKQSHLKGESSAKKKNYDQNAAREYMNKQKELRKEQRKKELLEKAQAKEMTKQKLKSLQEKRLQLVMAKPKQGNK